MKNKFINFYNRILCFFGIHKITEGYSWRILEGLSYGDRQDLCSRCNYQRWVKDEKGLQNWLFQIQMSNETRRVLIEKTSQEIRDLEYYLNENNWVEV